jgi:hypothetical protein
MEFRPVYNGSLLASAGGDKRVRLKLRQRFRVVGAFENLL